MPKQRVAYSEFYTETLEIMRDLGLLLVSVDKAGRHNPMAIGWGTMGSVWGKPIFCVLVRPSRFTHGLIEHSGDFTINVPTRDLHVEVMHCGTFSGRDEDKFTTTKMTPVPSLYVQSPVIDECPIQYECRIIHRNEILPETLDDEITQGAYADGDFHTVYFGEILAVHAEVETARQLHKTVDIEEIGNVPPDLK